MAGRAIYRTQKWAAIEMEEIESCHVRSRDQVWAVLFHKADSLEREEVAGCVEGAEKAVCVGLS